MPKPIRFDIETPLSPDLVKAALIDFTAERPAIWPGLTARLYKVHSIGKTTAEVQEGTAMPGKDVWARERYEWGRAGFVRWTTLESNFSAPGSYVQARFSRIANGGTRIHIEWNRIGTKVVGRIAGALVRLTGGRPVRTSFEKGLREIARRAGKDPDKAVGG